MRKIYPKCLSCGSSAPPDKRRAYNGRIRPFCNGCYRRMHADGRAFCFRCQSVKPVEAFGVNRRRVSGRQTACRDCWKPMTAEYRYGISPEDQRSLLDSQGGGCALCSRVVGAPDSPACIDHDHNTGSVRGILCRQCNSALGTLGDSVEGLRNALAYLGG